MPSIDVRTPSQFSPSLINLDYKARDRLRETHGDAADAGTSVALRVIIHRSGKTTNRSVGAWAGPWARRISPPGERLRREFPLECGQLCSPSSHVHRAHRERRLRQHARLKPRVHGARRRERERLSLALGRARFTRRQQLRAAGWRLEDERGAAGWRERQAAGCAASRAKWHEAWLLRLCGQPAPNGQRMRGPAERRNRVRIGFGALACARRDRTVAEAHAGNSSGQARGGRRCRNGLSRSRGSRCSCCVLLGRNRRQRALVWRLASGPLRALSGRADCATRPRLATWINQLWLWRKGDCWPRAGLATRPHELEWARDRDGGLALVLPHDHCQSNFLSLATR